MCQDSQKNPLIDHQPQPSPDLQSLDHVAALQVGLQSSWSEGAWKGAEQAASPRVFWHSQELNHHQTYSWIAPTGQTWPWVLPLQQFYVFWVHWVQQQHSSGYLFPCEHVLWPFLPLLEMP